MTGLIAEIHSILKNNNLTISTGESITSGLLQDALASVNGASSSFRGGITAYDIGTKEDYLGIDREHAEKCNCVSEKTAREMAIGSREMFQTDIAVATTGYAINNNSEAPHAFFAIAIKDEIYSGRIDLALYADRNENRKIVCDYVINQLHAVIFEHFPTKEVEQKFAIKEERILDIIKCSVNSYQIKQCYIAINENRTSRIRIVDDARAFATFKMSGNIEVEYEIPLGKAKKIYDSFAGGLGTVEKTRYIVDYYLDPEIKIEVDVFEGRHKGRYIAEIEVPHENYVLPDLPDWIDLEAQLDITSNAKLSMI